MTVSPLTVEPQSREYSMASSTSEVLPFWTRQGGVCRYATMSAAVSLMPVQGFMRIEPSWYSPTVQAMSRGGRKVSPLIIMPQWPWVALKPPLKTAKRSA